MKDIIALNLMVVTLEFGQDKTLSKIAERSYWRGMVDDVKEFCKRVTSAKEQTGSMYMYMCVKSLKRHLQSSTQVLHVRGEVWHTMHI